MFLDPSSIFSFFQTIGTLAAILFILGLVLLVIEIIMPGFGVAGGTGLILLVISILMTAENTTEALIMTAIMLAMVVLTLFIIFRSAKKGTLARRLILWSAARREEGFSASSDNSSLVGLDGVALTVLRPSGQGDFSGQRLDVVTEGEFIPAGTKIQIIRTEGRRIVVKPVRTEEPSGQA